MGEGYLSLMLRRLLPLVALLVLFAAPAAHAETDVNVNVDIGKEGDLFIVKGPVTLKAGDTARTVFVVDGPVTVERGATVTEDLVTIDGRVLVAGTVRGRVVTFGDPATVTATGVVGDGIRWASEKPRVAPGARVDGGVSQIDFDLGDGAPFVSAVAWWIAVSVSTLLLGLLLLWLAPRAAEATFARMREGGWGPSIGIGFVVVIGLPVLAFVALVTLVGIPFGIGLLLALLPLGALGYVTGAWVLGRALVGPPGRTVVAFLAGWAILRVVGLVPFLGALVFAVTAMFGLGALAWTMWRARRPPGPAGPGVGPESPLAPAI